MRSPESPEAVFFDAAGTLIRLKEPVGSTYATHARAFGLQEPFSRELCQRMDGSFRRVFSRHEPLLFHEPDLSQIGRLERDWWRRVVKETFQGIAEISDFGGFFDSLYHLYSTSEAWALEPGCSEVLEELQRRSVRVAVVSNFDSRLPGLLEILGIAHLLSEVVFSSGAGFAKPDPGIFRLALKRLSLRPGDCCHVGDDPEDDWRGAMGAGIRPVLYDPAGRHRRFKADRIEHLGEVITRLRGYGMQGKSLRSASSRPMRRDRDE